jgi:hypothetical protein
METKVVIEKMAVVQDECNRSATTLLFSRLNSTSADAQRSVLLLHAGRLRTAGDHKHLVMSMRDQS